MYVATLLTFAKIVVLDLQFTRDDISDHNLIFALYEGRHTYLD